MTSLEKIKEEHRLQVLKFKQNEKAKKAYQFEEQNRNNYMDFLRSKNSK